MKVNEMKKEKKRRSIGLLLVPLAVDWAVFFGFKIV